MEEILRSLGKIEGILQIQGEDLKIIKSEQRAITETLTRNTVVLDEHKKRSENNERLVEATRQQLDQRMKPLEKKDLIINSLGQVAGFLGATSVSAYAIIKALEAIHFLK